MTFSQRVAHGDRTGQGLHQRVRPEPQGFVRQLELGACLLQLTAVQMDARQGDRGRRVGRLAGQGLISQLARAGQVPAQSLREGQSPEAAVPLMGTLRGRVRASRPEDIGGPAEVAGREFRGAACGQHLNPQPRMAGELSLGDVLQQLFRPGRGARRGRVIPGAAGQGDAGQRRGQPGRDVLPRGPALQDGLRRAEPGAPGTGIGAGQFRRGRDDQELWLRSGRHGRQAPELVRERLCPPGVGELADSQFLDDYPGRELPVTRVGGMADRFAE